MRRLKSFSLVLTLLGCALMTFFPSSVFADSFNVDVSQGDVNWKHGIFTLRDLGLGEYAYLIVPTFCRELSGEIKLLKDNEPYRDVIRNRTNYKVTRLPKNQFSIEIIPGSPFSSNRVRENFIEKIVDRESTLSCNGYNLLFGTSSEDWDMVHSVDGAKSVKDLMNKIN
jgi:hypothetical protein